jgi:signal transduction histidine kinase/ActR/RegA family two-component response regulator
MSDLTSVRLFDRMRFLQRGAAVAVVLIGSLVLLGWSGDRATLKNVLPGLVTRLEEGDMKANTAVAVILAGLSLWLSVPGWENRVAKAVARGCAVATALIGLLTLCEYAFDWNPGIDQLLFRDQPNAPDTRAGRMALVTTGALIQIGLALLLLDARTRQGRWVAQFPALWVGLLSVQAQVGYLIGAEAFSVGGGYAKIAIYTTLSFSLLCFGIIVSRPDRGLVALLAAPDAGGFVARRLLPLALLPLALGYLMNAGESAGFWDTHFGLSLLLIAMIVSAAALITWNATVLSRVDGERERAEVALRRHAEELAEADRRKDQFLAMLAHELRNPLAPIRNAVQLLQHLGPAEPPLVRVREVIARQVAHQARLLDDLLDVSRITRGTIELRRQQLELTRLVGDAAEDHRRVLETGGLTLCLELPEEPVWIDGDPTRLAQVVGNLLGNATKFTEPGGQVRVRLVADPESQSAVLSVRDSGIGIEPTMLLHVFELFTQADQGLDRSRGGLGLGLALVKGLVEQHGGSVWAHSEGPGQGSEFNVLLPTTAAPPAEVAAPSVAPIATGPIRVLVVDDNRDAAETLEDLLALAGCTVALAFSGPQALAIAPEFHPEVVLCDLGLPGMSGYEVGVALRQHPASARAQLIAVSGYGQAEDRERSQAAGFDRHLVKPVDPSELLRLLELTTHQAAPPWRAR